MHVVDTRRAALPAPAAFTSQGPTGREPYGGACVPVAPWQGHLTSVTSMPHTWQAPHGCWCTLSLRSL